MKKVFLLVVTFAIVGCGFTVRDGARLGTVGALVATDATPEESMQVRAIFVRVDQAIENGELDKDALSTEVTKGIMRLPQKLRAPFIAVKNRIVDRIIQHSKANPLANVWATLKEAAEGGIEGVDLFESLREPE